MIAVAVLAYLLGSLVAGVLYSKFRKEDIRKSDLPGGSGIFRRYGLKAALVVTFSDLLKGCLVGYISSNYVAEYSWLAMFMLVIGHCYPIFFSFSGGGGIAPLLGFMLVSHPLLMFILVLCVAATIPLYRAKLQSKVGLNAIPFATAVILPLGLLLSFRCGGSAELIAGSVAMAIRSGHLLLQGKKIGK